ncbi:MAG TPA: transcriptional regulator NrdR [Firmicutes bacterium]|nr:transcriptional regulator NrdR [Bacillota bacterium]HAZ22442.1 transcriptional regulator NrdR [Bacillota bacterium]HBG43648.1 transcriptional regulator NrdR [Bacillota bacterium]HBL51126.1 transcriptional regulator NrdR [Bacillota bacterium]HBL69502.1 transcriptional regulator NrdR [Bacillota bacterium]
MKCPSCFYEDTRVLDSRPTEEGAAIRRRRECSACGRRFTTFERIEEVPLMVIKKDGSRQRFDRTKVLQGILKACEKRPISMAALEELAAAVERELTQSGEREVSSSAIGELVMDHLKEIDAVAYVRFASVYRQFADINSLKHEIEKFIRLSGGDDN